MSCNLASLAATRAAVAAKRLPHIPFGGRACYYWMQKWRKDPLPQWLKGGSYKITDLTNNFRFSFKTEKYSFFYAISLFFRITAVDFLSKPKAIAFFTLLSYIIELLFNFLTFEIHLTFAPAKLFMREYTQFHRCKFKVYFERQKN